MSIQSLDDATTDSDLSEDDAVEALLAITTPEPEKGDEDETDEQEGAETPEDDESEEGEQEAEQAPAADAEAEKAKEIAKASDEQVIEYSVNGETHTMTVAEAKRLGGQETAINGRSQELAQRRKDLDDFGQRTAHVLEGVLVEAKNDWEQYADLDWVALTRQLEDDEFLALRAEAKAAHDRFHGLVEKAENFKADQTKAVSKITEEQKADNARAIKAKVTNWSDTLEASVRQNAIEAYGFEKDDIEGTFDARILEALHDAMLYRQGKKVATEKLAKAPLNPLKSGKTGLDDVDREATKTMKRFKSTGSEDDAIAALLSIGSKRRR